MPTSKNYNTWLEQNYPRTCIECGYVANNPAMYSVHKKTHAQIPDGALCWKGCGQPAKFRNTKGNFCCTQVTQHCPAYSKEQSDRVKRHWVDNEDRKQQTKETFLKHCAGVPEVIAKQKKTLNEKFGGFTPEQIQDYRRYARRIRERAQRWAKANGYTLGQQTYHVDHRFSILDSFKNGLPEDIVNHPVNLQILSAKENSSKGSKSAITLEQLMEEIKLTQTPD